MAVEDTERISIRPIPDPTVLTTEQLVRAIKAEREHLQGRIDVLRETVMSLSTLSEERFRMTHMKLSEVKDHLQMEIDRVENNHREALAAASSTIQIALDKAERQLQGALDKAEYNRQLALSDAEKRVADRYKTLETINDERLAAVRRGIDVAFVAARESVSAQNDSNSKAIGKSEIAVADTINKLSELFRSTTDGLADKHEDLKDRVNRIESIKKGGQETLLGIYAMAGFILTVLVIIGILAASGVFSK